jgi:hypothetical protein
MTEHWKSVNEHYSVSTIGRVRNDRSGRVPSVLKVGYEVVCVGGKKGERKYVHRLIAEAFLAADDGRPHVNHKDGVKTNNALENLEWCTHAENMQHAQRSGLVANRGVSLHAMLAATRKPVERICLKTGLVLEVFSSLNECMRKTGLSSVRHCVTDIQKSTGGFGWRYQSAIAKQEAA